MRNDLNQFLKDIDQDLQTDITAELPEYENKSDGYLKIRNLNQGIIIRKQEGYGVGLENTTKIPAGTMSPAGTNGDPDTYPAIYHHPHTNDDTDGYGPSYLMNGFTISMWVRFLDNTTRGTLFNFGNPLRGLDPKGFMLETYVLGKNELMSDGVTTWGDIATDTDVFSNADYERFIRLVVYDHKIGLQDETPKLYDSHIGITGLDRQQYVPDFGKMSDETTGWERGYEGGLLQHTRVPIDLQEWYFIVASYNPLIVDDIDSTPHNQDSDYWRGNRNAISFNDPLDFTHYSGWGAKCKVEIISRSDLLRARGYKV